ncbi:MAG TPA: AAA family ATPase [Gemmataceae bacterium]|jgi:predicted ATPase
MATVPENEVVTGTDERTKPPFLRRVRIRGYKSIAFCDVALQPLTILVGRNASGKSNFIDALAFLRDAMATNIAEATKRHGGWHSILSRFSLSGEISFEMELSLPPASLPTLMVSDEPRLIAEYGVALKEGPSGSPVLSREWFSAGEIDGAGNPRFNATGIYSPDRKNVDFDYQFHHHQIPCSQVPYPHPNHLWIGLFGKPPFRDVSDDLRFSSFYNFIPEAMRRVQPATSGQLLDQHGWNLASVIEATRENDEDVIERIGHYLSVITESVELVGPVKYGEYETVRFRVARDAQSQPLEFDAASMSDGTLRALAALVAAFQIVLPHGHPSLIAIEEPETSLHPAATHALVSALEAATEHTQVLLTTHSGDLLADPKLSPSSVLVVRLRDGQTEIAPVDPASREIIHRELYTLADLHRLGQLNPDEEHLERQASEARED